MLLEPLYIDPLFLVRKFTSRMRIVQISEHLSRENMTMELWKMCM